MAIGRLQNVDALINRLAAIGDSEARARGILARNRERVADMQALGITFTQAELNLLVNEAGLDAIEDAFNEAKRVYLSNTDEPVERSR